MWRIYVRKYIEEHPKAGRWYARVERGPSWAIGPAVGVAALVIVVPLVLLSLAAVAAGLIVFLLLALVGQVFSVIRSIWRGLTGQRDGAPLAADGRHNVRVIHR